MRTMPRYILKRRFLKYFLHPFIHLPEEEYGEYFRVCKSQNNNSSEFCESDSGEDGAAHVYDGLPCILDSVLTSELCEVAHDVSGELHADSHGHDKVGERHRVEGDVPPVHEGAEIHEYEENSEEDNDG